MCIFQTNRSFPEHKFLHKDNHGLNMQRYLPLKKYLVMMDREKLALTFFHEAHKVHLHMNYDTIVWKLILDKIQTKCRRENEKK